MRVAKPRGQLEKQDDPVKKMIETAIPAHIQSGRGLIPEQHNVAF